MCVGLTKGAFVLREGTVARCASEGTSVAQLSSNKIVCDVAGSTCFAIEKNVTLRGCCCTQDTVYVWSASSLWVHDASAGEGTQLPLQTPLVAAHGNNFYTPSPRGIEAFSRSGVPVATLEIDPNDGRITVMSVRWFLYLFFITGLRFLFYTGLRPLPRRCHQLQRVVPVGREQARPPPLPRHFPV